MSTLDNHGAGSIITPEAVVLDFELAGVASRGLAFAIDFIVQVIAFAVIAFMAGLIGTTSGVAGIVTLLVGAILIVIGYPVAMETLNQGRSLGRMVVGTRVVTVEGAPTRFRHSFTRALLAIPDLLISFGGLAVITALLTKRGQRLGDLAGGTMVIRERTAKLNRTAHTFHPPAGFHEWAMTMDTGGLGDDGYRLIRDFLVRRDMSDAPRARLAVDLAAFTAARLPLHPQPAGLSAEGYLQCVASAAQGITTTYGGGLQDNIQPPPPSGLTPPLTGPPMGPSGIPAPPSQAPMRLPGLPVGPSGIPAPPGAAPTGQPAPLPIPEPEPPAPPNEGGFATPG